MQTNTLAGTTQCENQALNQTGKHRVPLSSVSGRWAQCLFLWTRLKLVPFLCFITNPSSGIQLPWQKSAEAASTLALAQSVWVMQLSCCWPPERKWPHFNRWKLIREKTKDSRTLLLRPPTDQSYLFPKKCLSLVSGSFAQRMKRRFRKKTKKRVS